MKFGHVLAFIALLSFSVASLSCSMAHSAGKGEVGPNTKIMGGCHSKESGTQSEPKQKERDCGLCLSGLCAKASDTRKSSFIVETVELSKEGYTKTALSKSIFAVQYQVTFTRDPSRLFSATPNWQSLYSVYRL